MLPAQCLEGLETGVAALAGGPEGRIQGRQGCIAGGEHALQVGGDDLRAEVEALRGACPRVLFVRTAAAEAELREGGERRDAQSRGLADSVTDASTHRRFLSRLSRTWRCVVRASSRSGL